MTKKQFRYLLLIFLALEGFNILFGKLFPMAIPEALLRAKELSEINQPQVPMIYLVMWILLFFGTWISALIGLFMFKNWAPIMAFTATLINLIGAPVLGIDISSGWEVLWSDLSFTLWGMILGLIYFSPVKEHFNSST
jgi:hypothetical protein